VVFLVYVGGGGQHFCEFEEKIWDAICETLILEILVFLEKSWYFHDLSMFHFDNCIKWNALVLFNLTLYHAYPAIVCVEPPPTQLLLL